MTIREAYEHVLTECNKVKAPSILIEDFNYLFNKAVQQYINIVYNRCELNQQSSDDLGFLQTVATLPLEGTKYEGSNGYYYKFALPTNYLHALGCKVKFESSNTCSTSNNV